MQRIVGGRDRIERGIESGDGGIEQRIEQPDSGGTERGPGHRIELGRRERVRIRNRLGIELGQRRGFELRIEQQRLQLRGGVELRIERRSGRRRPVHRGRHAVCEREQRRRDVRSRRDVGSSGVLRDGPGVREWCLPAGLLPPGSDFTHSPAGDPV